jgi:hypothetical protein
MLDSPCGFFDLPADGLNTAFKAVAEELISSLHMGSSLRAAADDRECFFVGL